MKLLLTTLAAIGLPALAFTQTTSLNPGGSTAAAAPTQYDANGDPIGPAGPSVAAPGDLWSQFVTPLSDTDGMAPYQGGLLVCDSGGSIAHISETGAFIGSTPTLDLNDAWLAYDTSRDLIITTNASADVIRGYTFGNGTPVFDIPSPTPGPTGAAYDSTRDEYAYCDWSTDDIVILNASTLGVVRTFNYSGTLDRMAGLAYDCTDDVYVVGDRDTRTHTAINPVTGATGYSYLTAGLGGSNPRGAALSSDGGIWVGDWNLTGVYLQEGGHGPTTACSGGTPWTAFCAGDGVTNGCPCGNLGAAGAGCQNSTGAGSTLTASGTANVAANDLVLSGTGLPPGVPGLFFAGNSAIVPPAFFGDGLRCAGGQIVRLQVVFVNGAGNAATSIGIASTLGATPGQNSILQLWYRDTTGPCGSGFNTTGALDLTWQ